MKLNKKIVSLLVAAVMAVVLMPVCMAAPGDSITTRVQNAMNTRASADLYQEIATTTPDGTTQNMVVARSNGNVYIKMELSDVGELVYVLKDGQGYLLDNNAKLAIKGDVPQVTLNEAEGEDTDQSAQGVETTVNVNGQDYEALSYSGTDDDGKNVTVSYCLDGDNLKYMVTDNAEGRTVVEYKVTSTTVDQNLFTIPADYQIMTQDELAAATAEK